MKKRPPKKPQPTKQNPPPKKPTTKQRKILLTVLLSVQGGSSLLGVHIPAKEVLFLQVFLSILSAEFEELFANNLFASIQTHLVLTSKSFKSMIHDVLAL